MLVCKKNREEFLCPDLLPSLFYSKFKLTFCANADRKRFQSRPVMLKKLLLLVHVWFLVLNSSEKNCERFPPIEPLTAKIAVIAPPPMTISFVLHSFVDICWHLLMFDIIFRFQKLLNEKHSIPPCCCPLLWNHGFWNQISTPIFALFLYFKASNCKAKWVC